MTVNGTLKAAAQVTLYPRAGEGGTFHVDASIGWIAAEDDPSVILDFIGRIERDAKAAGATELGMFSRNELGLGWFGIPDRAGHLIKGFEAAGYAKGDDWTILAAEVEKIRSGRQPGYAGMTLDRFDRPDEAEHEFVVRIKGADAAEAALWSPPAIFSDAEDFTAWTTLEIIEVQAPFRRQGLARWLLGEQARWLETRRIRNLIAWVEPSNIESLNLLTGSGFHAMTTSRCFHKPLA